MIQTKTKFVLDFGSKNSSTKRALVHSSLESTLKGLFPKTVIKSNFQGEPQYNWSNDARTNGIVVDLHKTQWFDLSATARLVLIIEKAVKDGLDVEIILPADHFLPGEKHWLLHYEEVNNQNGINRINLSRSNRIKALDFLKVIHFKQAVSCVHLNNHPKKGNVVFVINNERQQLTKGNNGKAEYVNQESGEIDYYEFEPKYKHENIFPLTWVPALVDSEEEQERIKSIERGLTKILSNFKRGILKLDAEAISNVVFHELLKNVKDHSKCSHALIAAWPRPKTLPVISDDYLEGERVFFESWIKENSLGWVDLFFGDSGEGIVGTLNESYKKTFDNEGVPSALKDPNLKILFWALSRWSTSSSNKGINRGTRGLYRIHRLIKGYSGLLSIRTGSLNAGWNHGGVDVHEAFHESGKFNVPGTTLLFRLPALIKSLPQIAYRTGGDENMDYFVLPTTFLDRIEKNNLQHDIRKSLSIRKNEKRETSAVLMLENIPKSVESKEKSLRTLFEKIRNLSNPGVITILCPQIAKEELETYVDSMNQEYRHNRSIGNYISKERDYDIVNPFILVTRDFQLLVVGTTKIEEKWLSSLNTQGKSEVEVEPELAIQLREHPALYKFLTPSIAKIRVSPFDVYEAVLKRTKKRLADIIENCESEFVIKGHFYSSNLILVDRWLKLESLTKNFGWFHISDKALDNSNLNNGNFYLDDGYHSYSTVEFNKKLGGTNYSRAQRRSLEQLRGFFKKPSGETPLYMALAHELKLNGILSNNIDFLVSNHYQTERITLGLKQTIGIEEDVIEMPTNTMLSEDSEIWELIDKKKVLIYVDALLSGSTIKQIIAHLVKENAVPIAVSCLYDFRLDCNSSINVFGFDVPVVSIYSNNSYIIQQWDNKKGVFIDALTHRIPDSHLTPPSIQYPIKSEDLNDYIVETSALQFQHIIRENHQHFTFYLDQLKLFKSRKAIEKSKYIIDLELKSFAASLEKEHQIKDYSKNLQIVGLADDLGISNIKKLVNKKFGIPALIDRNQNGFGFGQVPGRVKGKNVLLLVYTLSETSLERLTYQLAQGGANSVITITWLSRISPYYEQVLRSIEVMKVSQPFDHGAKQTSLRLYPSLHDSNIEKDWYEKSVPVKHTFLSHMNIPLYSDHNCPICKQRKRIRNEKKPLGNILLTKYSQQLIKRTKPIRINQTRGFGEIEVNQDISNEMAIEMYYYHNLLERCKYSTERRYELLDKLNKLNNDLNSPRKNTLNSIHALFYLLSTELYWIKSPPLSFEPFRLILSNMALTVLLRKEHSGTGRKLSHAIIVLRATDKERLAQNVLHIVKIRLNRSKLITQLAFDLFTILSQDHHHYRGLLRPLISSLDEVIKFLEEKIKNSDTQYSKYDSILELYRAIHLLAIRQDKAIDEPLDLIQAWYDLKKLYDAEYKSGHELLPEADKALFLNMEPHYEFQNEEIGDITFWKGALNAWNNARNFLEKDIFPLMRNLEDIWSGPFSRSVSFGFDDIVVGLLEDLVNPQKSKVMDEINYYLTQFSLRAPKPQEKEWSEYKKLRGLLSKYILKGQDLETMDKGSHWLQFLKECPANLKEIVKEMSESEYSTALDEVEFKNRSLEELIVFCHETLVRDIVKELIINVSGHSYVHNPKPLELLLITDKVDNMISLEAYCSGTDKKRVSNKGGRGLALLNQRIAPYGGRVTHYSLEDHEWGYYTKILFKSYR